MLLFSHQYENIKSFRMTNGTKIENSNPDNCRPKKKEKKVKILILIFSISTFRAKLLLHPPHSHNQKEKKTK